MQPQGSEYPLTRASSLMSPTRRSELEANIVACSEHGSTTGLLKISQVAPEEGAVPLLWGEGEAGLEAEQRHEQQRGRAAQ